MRLVHAAAVPWTTESGHRTGKIEFRRLLQGEPGSRENYELSLVRMAGYSTPRHRHNFDQIRMTLVGSMNWAKGRDLAAGSVGYFPEGTWYGPQEVADESLGLLLQFGGAGGAGFMSYDQLRGGYADLCRLGEFRGGVFRRGAGAGRPTQDGYEAIWEHVFGRPLEYPPPRYEDPVIMDPAAYAWRKQGGLSRKRLGEFTERGTALELWRLGPGAQAELVADGARKLGFVLRGEGSANGQRYGPLAAFEVDYDEAAELEASSESELLAIALPRCP